jgi:RNA polymerase sigma-70 factor (ECF subfamily)
MAPDDYQRFVLPIQGRMVDCVWRIVRDSHETEDVVQEALLQIMQRFDEVRRHPNPTAFLLRICVNKALDHVRGRQSRHAAMDRLAMLPEEAGTTPAREMARADDRRLVLEFLRTIPDREAEAITLYALEDLDYPTVAAAMGCAQGTVRVLVRRARERFREAFPRGLGGLGEAGSNNSTAITP